MAKINCILESMNVLYRNDFFTGLPPLDIEFLHNKHCYSCLCLSSIILCMSATNTNLTESMIPLFRTMTVYILLMPLRPPPTSPASGFLCTLKASNFKHWLLSLSAWGQNPSRTDHGKCLPEDLRPPLIKRERDVGGWVP